MDQERNVTNLDEYRPHAVSEVVCLKCLKRWLAVRPASVWLKDIECPNCGPGFVINTGQDLTEDD